MGRTSTVHRQSFRSERFPGLHLPVQLCLSFGKQFMRYGAAHASEIGYVFENLRGWNGAQFTAQDTAVSKIMNSYWTNFAKTGNPNGAGLSEWPIYTPADNKILEIKPNGSAVGEVDPKKARLDVIEKAVTSGNLH